jgi:hypothetical protein
MEIGEKSGEQSRFTEGLQFVPGTSFDQGNRSTNPAAKMQFGSISGIDENTYMGDLSRVTGLMSPKDRITTTSNDNNLILFLQEAEQDGVYLADMGEIDELERSNFILDKDTQMVYDSRKENDLVKLEKRTSANFNTSVDKTALLSDNSLDISASAGDVTQNGDKKRRKKKAKPWANFWE